MLTFWQCHLFIVHVHWQYHKTFSGKILLGRAQHKHLLVIFAQFFEAYVRLFFLKIVPFTFNNNMHQQRNGSAMGSPLGPVLARIIMVELENSIVPKLNSHWHFWKRYVDDTLTIVKEGSINHVLQQLNSFHPNMQFTFETPRGFLHSILFLLLQ